MRKRDQHRGLFGRHDPGELRGDQRVAFGDGRVPDRLSPLRAEPNLCAREGGACRHRFLTNIHHHDRTVGRDMRGSAHLGSSRVVTSLTVFPSMVGSPGFGTARSVLDGLFVLAALGDVAAGEDPGFAQRVASVALHFAAPAGVAPELHAAVYAAALLHEIGTIHSVAPVDAIAPSERRALLWPQEAPLRGAHRIQALTLPPQTADFIRWHREAWDGTGFPDRLRWDANPLEAAVVGIARAFVTLVWGAGGVDAYEALVELERESGRQFSPAMMERLREFIFAHGNEIARDVEPAGLVCEPAAILNLIEEMIDAHTPGRISRVAKLAQALGAALGLTAGEQERLAVLAPLHYAGAVRRAAQHEMGFDPLSRFDREERALDAVSGAAMVARIESYEDLARVLRAVHEWFDGTGVPDAISGEAIPPSARIIAVAAAHEALRGFGRESPVERIGAAAGSQFDPQVVAALRAVAGRP